MGYDTDQPEALGEFGKCGVAVSSLKDMEILFDGIPLDKVSTEHDDQLTSRDNLGNVLCYGREQRCSARPVARHHQNDISRNSSRQKEYIFPPEPSMRLVVDTMEFGAQKVPQWNTISISGYHIREAGSTAAQELAFTLDDGLEYVRWGIARGMDVDDFAPRLSFFFNAHNDFFEEIAKYRAARRIWAREMRETFKAKNPRSWLLRFHTQTAGVSLTAQQPENNVVRVAIQALPLCSAERKVCIPTP
jgi:methylmalonyl-CoA mutase N-terminal domain/subunit